MTSNFTKQPGQDPTFISLNLFIRQGYLLRVACQYRLPCRFISSRFSTSSAIDLDVRDEETTESDHQKVPVENVNSVLSRVPLATKLLSTLEGSNVVVEPGEKFNRSTMT